MQWAFERFVDSLLDLLVPQSNSVDHYKKPVYLFLGPDEGTAEYMDWATMHAKERGYKMWKSFSTGKTKAIGGIPHDIYGMTTISVQE